MKSRFTLSLFLIVLSFISLEARHLLGGSAAYQVSSQGDMFSTVDFEFNLFRDNLSGGANFDNNGTFGVYGVNSNGVIFLQKIVTGHGAVKDYIQSNSADCPLFEYSSTTYSFSVTLPNFTYDYYIVTHQRCCRPGVISNIMNPDESGFALSVTIYPEAFEHSEKANALPTSSIPFMVSSQGVNLAELSPDDNYTKEFSLTTPLNAGGIGGVNLGDPTACDGITPEPQNCPPPFGTIQYIDENNPFGNNSDVSIDTELGELSMTIPSNGITLFETTVKRYMDGVLLSSINNQWTTISAMCTFGPLSTDEDLDCNEIVLAPNPSSSTIYASCTLSDVSIIDALGRKVKTIDSMKAKEEVSIIDLNAGIYRLIGTSEDGDIVTIQFVKSNR